MFNADYDLPLCGDGHFEEESCRWDGGTELCAKLWRQAKRSWDCIEVCAHNPNFGNRLLVLTISTDFKQKFQAYHVSLV